MNPRRSARREWSREAGRVTMEEVLDRLRVLARLERPVGLAGGVAADFHVGRWTRDHGDIDLVTFEEHREGLDRELRLARRQWQLVVERDRAR